MNKVKFILAFIVIAIFITACDKKENGDEDQDTTPKDTKVTLTYKVTAENLSPIFNATIQYKNENNQTITLENEALPWEKTITVTTPFDASINGKYVVIANAEIPDPVTVGQNVFIIQNGINMNSTQSHLSIAKNRLDEWLSERSFSLTHKFE
jgi:hypothetical protein